MAFNYLQTDDRDNYFAQFGHKPKENPIVSLTLVDQNGNILLKEVPMFKVRAYAKKNYVPTGQSAKRIWRVLLESKGYTVINNYSPFKPEQP